MESKEPNKITYTVYRRLLWICATIYFIWWFAVELLLKDAFNPILSRFLVVGILFLTWGLTYFSSWVRRHLKILTSFCVWLVTFHYFYLFYKNNGASDWVVGSFITVIAVSFCFLSIGTLLVYSLFVIAISVALMIAIPDLTHSIFFPGILTVLVQANIGLGLRLRLIKTILSSNDRYELLFNSTFEGVIVHEDEIITEVNRSLLEMTGFQHRDLVGKPLLNVVHPGDRNFVSEKIRSGEEIPYELRFLKNDGTFFEVEGRGRLFLNEDRKVSRLFTIKDLVDRRRSEKDRMLALTMTENVRIRDEFISLASHELKTPVSSLKLQTQMIDRELARKGMSFFDEKKLREISSLFNRQVDRLLELVESMLDVSRISGGLLNLNRKKVDLAALVKEVIAFQARPDSFRIDAEDPVLIYADESRIKQVAENLISNAIKYGRGNPIFVKVKFENSRAVFSVQDQGIGVAPEFADRIFNRFERAVPAQNISGLGLGLYIAKQIMVAHGGDIFVRSQLGKGSVFTAVLATEI